MECNINTTKKQSRGEGESTLVASSARLRIAPNDDDQRRSLATANDEQS